MKTTMQSLAFVATVALFANTATAATIYSDDFSGGSGTDLNGLAPDVRPGSETWTAKTDWKADGTATIDDGSAWLPFTPVAGNVYTVTLDMDNTNAGDNDWIGLGFSDSSDTTTAFNNVGSGPIVFGTAFALNMWSLRKISGVALFGFIAHNSRYGSKSEIRAEARQEEENEEDRRARHHGAQVLRSTCAVARAAS